MMNQHAKLHPSSEGVYADEISDDEMARRFLSVRNDKGFIEENPKTMGINHLTASSEVEADIEDQTSNEKHTSTRFKKKRKQ